MAGGAAYEGGYLGLIVIAVIFGVINGLIGPIVKMLALPLTFMTMGLIGFLINAVLLLATAFVSLPGLANTGEILQLSDGTTLIARADSTVTCSSPFAAMATQIVIPHFNDGSAAFYLDRELG